MGGERSGGLLVSDNILAIQAVSPAHSGWYGCSAGNSVAANTSEALHLQVKCESREEERKKDIRQIIISKDFNFIM